MLARHHVVMLAAGLAAVTLVRASRPVAREVARDLAPQEFGPFGGPGGTAFTRTCGPDRVMTGFRARAGFALDAIGLLCRPVGSDGQLGTESSVGALAGGTGGTASTARCPNGTVAAGATIHRTVVQVVGFAVTCRPWRASFRSFGTPSTTITAGIVAAPPGVIPNTAACTELVQPVRSIRGRSGSVVDALGITCDEP